MAREKSVFGGVSSVRRRKRTPTDRRGRSEIRTQPRRTVAYRPAASASDAGMRRQEAATKQGKLLRRHVGSDVTQLASTETPARHLAGGRFTALGSLADLNRQPRAKARPDFGNHHLFCPAEKVGSDFCYLQRKRGPGGVREIDDGRTGGADVPLLFSGRQQTPTAAPS